MAVVEQADITVKLSVRDGLSSGLRGAQSRLQALDRSFQRTQASLGKTVRNFQLLGTAAIGAAAVSVKFAADFEEQLRTINTVAGVTDEQLVAIGDSLRALASDTGTSLADLTSGYYDLVSAGIAAADAQIVLENANTLAIGGLSTTGEAIDLLTTALNSYGIKAKNVQKVTDGFAQAIAAGKVTASEIAGSFARVAPLAAAAGIGIDELQAALAQMTASGVPAAEVATSLRSAIVALQRPNATLNKAQKETGINFAKLAKQKGLQVAYQQLTKYAKEHGVSLVELVGRVEATQFALLTTGTNAKSYEKNLRDVRNASNGAGVAARQMQERQKSLNATFRKVRETARDIAITFGEALAPSVRRIANAILSFVKNNKPEIEDFADKVGDLVDAVTTDESISTGISGALDFLRGMPWATIGSGLKITGDAAKLAVDAFKGLDPNIQKALIGILAANKLTGGLVTSVFRDLTGIALKSLTTINAAQVTVIGGTVTGGTGGGGGAPIPPGGKGSTLGSVAGKILGATIIVGSAIAVFDQFQATAETINVAAQDLAGKAGESAGFGGAKSVSDLKTFAESLGGQDAFGVLGTMIGGGNPSVQKALTNLGSNIAGDKTLSAGQLEASLSGFDAAIKVANDRWWPDTVATLKEQKATVQARLEELNKKTLEGNRYTTSAAQRSEELLSKIPDSMRTTVNVSATTNLNVSEVGQKLQVASGGGYYVIR